jgi:hypothetical protein
LNKNNIDLQTECDKLTQDRNILKDNISDIEKSLDLSNIENDRLKTKNDSELKYVNNKLNQMIIENKKQNDIILELNNTINNLENYDHNEEQSNEEY